MIRAVGLISLIILTSTTFLGCSSNEKAKAKLPEFDKMTRKDAHSYSNFEEIHTKHLHLELDVNFENNTIYGVARHQMINNGADTAVFDIKYLDIQKVTLGKGTEQPADFIIGEFDSILGSPLMVAINENTEYINIYYNTTKKCEALDWLAPEQTSGKEHPFLYSQGQAILTRSWIPVQGTPEVRITYSADVKVPKELLPIMSAENPISKNETGQYHFEMKQPIPVYLIAIAIGDLSYKSLGKNCGVYAEKDLINACAYEFVDLPKMITAAEKIYGKYQWEQYDIAVLPYSFPFGGMENPRLTFANPTLIAGDRSLVSVIAHELAHSWSGNLVTNASWDDFWLNEGFTVYFENRIMEELYGKEVADILVNVEFQELQNTLKKEKKEDTKLKLNLDHRSPDEGMTDIAYIKGASFLRTLEAKVGRERMDKFMNAYFKHFSFKAVSTEEFVAYLESELLEPNNISFNVKEWIYEPGIPSNCVMISSERLQKMEAIADKLVAGKDIFANKKIKRENYTTQEWQTFIRRLPKKMEVDKMRLVDQHLHFNDCGNAEIMSEWYVLAIKSGYTEIRPDMEKFLAKVGRRKYLEPIYETLASSGSENKLWGQTVFDRVRGNYHYVSQTTIEGIIR